MKSPPASAGSPSILIFLDIGQACNLPHVGYTTPVPSDLCTTCLKIDASSLVHHLFFPCDNLLQRCITHLRDSEISIGISHGTESTSEECTNRGIPQNESQNWILIGVSSSIERRREVLIGTSHSAKVAQDLIGVAPRYKLARA